jgi:hypothetical protein
LVMLRDGPERRAAAAPAHRGQKHLAQVGP